MGEPVSDIHTCRFMRLVPVDRNEIKQFDLNDEHLSESNRRKIISLSMLNHS